jgi:hypothetical protein
VLTREFVRLRGRTVPLVRPDRLYLDPCDFDRETAKRYREFVRPVMANEWPSGQSGYVLVRELWPGYRVRAFVGWLRRIAA